MGYTASRRWRARSSDKIPEPVRVRCIRLGDGERMRFLVNSQYRSLTIKLGEHPACKRFDSDIVIELVAQPTTPRSNALVVTTIEAVDIDAEVFLGESAPTANSKILRQTVDWNFQHASDEEIATVNYAEVFRQKVAFQTDVGVGRVVERTAPRIGCPHRKVDHAGMQMIAARALPFRSAQYVQRTRFATPGEPFHPTSSRTSVSWPVTAAAAAIAGRDQMGPRARALAADEVAVAGRGAALARRHLVGVHRRGRPSSPARAIRGRLR